MRVIYPRPGDPPWNVITVMVRLTAELLDAELLEVHYPSVRQRFRRLGTFLPRKSGKEPLLVVAPEPVDLNAVLHARTWTHGYSLVAGLVVDSWWDDRIPRCARTGYFDVIYVTERESVEPWRQATGAEVRWLPQGSNVLEWGSGAADRPTTVQRLGRQPTSWDDDASVAATLRRAGLTFNGRPPFEEDPSRAMRDLLRTLGRARYTLAFSNRLDETTYTHPTREYVTGRWTDALAAGSVVAGIPPRCATTSEILWPEGLLEFGDTRLETGVEAIKRAEAEWSPAIPALNYLRSLERLDWRWRILQIADDLNVRSPALDADMARLRAAIDDARSSWEALA